MFANFFGISYPRPRPHIYHVCLPNQAVFYPLPPVDMDVLYEWSLGEHPPEAAGVGDGGAEGSLAAAIGRPVPVGLAAVVGWRGRVEA